MEENMAVISEAKNFIFIFIGLNLSMQNLSIYYTWKNLRNQYKNNKPKIIASTGNGEFKLPGGSYSLSDIQDYIECIIKQN